MFNKDLFQEARKNAFFLVATIAMGVGIGVTVVIQSRLISQIISRVFLEENTVEQVQPLVFYLIAAVVFRAVFLLLQDLTAGRLSSQIMHNLRNRLFSRVLELGPVQIGQERTGELSNVIFQGVEKLDVYFREYLPRLALAGIIPLLVLIFVFPIDWLTGIIFLFTAPLIPLFMILIGQQAEIETKRQWNVLGKLNGYFFDVIRGLETIKNFSQSSARIKDIREKSEQYAILTLRVLRIAFLSALVLEMLATISTAVVAVQIGLRLLYGKMALVDGLFLLILAPEFYLPLRQLGASFHAGREGVAAAERIYQVLGSGKPQKVSPGRQKTIHFSNLIEFRNVSFQYKEKERPSVAELNFNIARGDHAALVGRSGGGKSTIAALLLGFILPHNGEVLVDGQPLTTGNVQAWRRQIAYIPQFPYLFNGTIEDNMRIAKENASDAEIVQAVQYANAEEFILRLPEKYNTIIGEDGAKISRGQAQRLAIARAFLRDAALWIVDEPTASLDPQNEHRISEILQQVRYRCTVLVIAHRLSTVVNADTILVLDHGRIVETGTHKQLIQKSGLYMELVGSVGGYQ